MLCMFLQSLSWYAHDVDNVRFYNIVAQGPPHTYRSGTGAISSGDNGIVS